MDIQQDTQGTVMVSEDYRVLGHVWGQVAVTTGEFLAWSGWRPGPVQHPAEPRTPTEKDPPIVHSPIGTLQ
jgi:hypothetical protein